MRTESKTQNNNSKIKYTKQYVFLVLLITMFSHLAVFASEYTHQVQNYKEAEKDKTYIRFDMKSTKLGLFTTTFTGFVKKFTAYADPVDTELKNLRLSFSADALDTNIDGRNDKMWQQCLDSKKHPNLSVQLNAPLPLDTQEVSIPATLTLRGYDKPITLQMKANKTEIGYTVDGKTELSIKALEIPDPSIAIASVSDQIKIEFHIEVPKEL